MSKRVFLMVAVLAQLFSAHPAMAESVKFDISEFSVEGNTLLPLSNDEIQKILEPFVGSGRDMADVNKAAEALRALYHKAGYSVVQVIPPVQTITKGKVVLKVVEDKIISIDVKGNSAYDADNIRASLPVLQVGKSLNAKHLEAAIALANENSAKQVAVNVQPGANLGDISTRIDVTEDRITKFVATLDNTGSAATGYTKVGLAYQDANLFNLDHALTLQYSGSPDSISKTGSINAGYHMPLYEYGLSLDFIAAYSSSNTQNGAIYFAGKGTVLGARLNYALDSIAEFRHKLIFGVDYKDTNNNYTACTGTCGSITEQPMSLTYFAQMARPEFQGSGNVTLVSNLSGGSNSSSADYQTARATVGTLLATPVWDILRFNANAAIPLPEDWQVRAALNGQYSRDLLLPAEQFGAGGATAFVRGYPERVASGEKGYAANLELYTPDINKYLEMTDSSLRMLVFWDGAKVTLNDQYPAAMGVIDTTTDLSSYGLGLRFSYMKDLSLKVDVGWAQKQVPFGTGLTTKNDVRGHLAFSYIF